MGGHESVKEISAKPIVLRTYSDKNKKLEVLSFIDYYKIRYNYIKKILQIRNGLGDAVSVNRLKNKRRGDKVSTIGIVYSKGTTKNDHIVLEIEDVTGMAKFMIMKTKDELYSKARDIVCDEVIGIKGVMGDGLLFADQIFFPEFSESNGLKKGQIDEYVAFISDVHVGSDIFMEENFLRFINWINGKYGNKEQKEAGLKVKYLFIVGDLVDGVGVYPGQESNLKIKDITAQYDKLAELIAMIRNDVQIIVCPGDHDAVRLAEPQPALDKSLAESVWALDNVTLVTNPSFINIGGTKDFEGFNVLIYHGRSFSYFIDVLDSVREAGGYDGIDYLLKLLLKKRHLAPSHESTLSVINPEEDGLIIEQSPDFFAVGHIHRSKVSQVGNTTLISGSCWQPLNDHQEKLGHNPEPGRVPIVNLKTREVKVMKFIDD
jgi:DNA polymerase II small subunit